MKIIAGLLALCFLAWQLGIILSPDAVGMAVGMLFGILGAIPTALLILASNRRRGPHEEDQTDEERGKYHFPPPVIILNSPTARRDDWELADYARGNCQLEDYAGDSMRRVALPKSDEQKRLKRRIDAGMIRRLEGDGAGEVPPGFRKLTRRANGKIEREEYS